MIDAKEFAVRERKYRKPPIVEVVCEFRFAPFLRWDPAVFELVYEHLKDLFPFKRPLRQVGVHVQMEAQTVSFQQEIKEGVQFLREDERALVRVQPHRVSVHHLAPYPHWEGFKPLIEKLHKACLDVLRGVELRRVGLRYINRISLPATAFELPDYFTLYPAVGATLPQDFSGFELGLLYFFQNGRDGLRLRLANEKPEQEGFVTVLLDLDYFLAREGTVDAKDALVWVEEAHRHIVRAFEGAITDRLRERFEEEA